MAREDMPTGGVVYYGYSKIASEDWTAAVKELRKGTNTAPMSTTVSTSAFSFAYSWMASGYNVFKIEETDATKGLAFTIYVTGTGAVWAWISGSSGEDMDSPKWSGRTSGTIWTSGQSGVNQNATSVSFALIPLDATASQSKKATVMYMVEAGGNDATSPWIYPNSFTTNFTPFQSTLSGTPSSTTAAINVFGPIHAPKLAGAAKSGILALMPTQTTQSMPPGDYSASGVLSGYANLRGVMPGHDGHALLFLNADTGTSTYDEE